MKKKYQKPALRSIISWGKHHIITSKTTDEAICKSIKKVA